MVPWEPKRVLVRLHSCSQVTLSVHVRAQQPRRAARRRARGGGAHQVLVPAIARGRAVPAGRQPAHAAGHGRTHSPKCVRIHVIFILLLHAPREIKIKTAGVQASTTHYMHAHMHAHTHGALCMGACVACVCDVVMMVECGFVHCTAGQNSTAEPVPDTTSHPALELLEHRCGAGNLL